MYAIKTPSSIFYGRTKYRDTVVLCHQLELRPGNQNHLMHCLDLGKNFIESFRFANLKNTMKSYNTRKEYFSSR